MAITLGLALRVDYAPAVVLQPEPVLRTALPVLNVTPSTDPVASLRAYGGELSDFKGTPYSRGNDFLTYSRHGEGQLDAAIGRNINIFA